MCRVRNCRRIALFLLSMLAAAKVWAGPPFQTDDPTPIDFRHYEVYLFGTTDGTPVEVDPGGPAIEANWGAAPNLHLHIILPFGAIIPSNNPRYSPAGIGPTAYGLQDIELGAKYRFIKETKHRPEFGTFTMFEIPTGSYSRGLGVGKVWYKLPIWAQKSWGHLDHLWRRWIPNCQTESVSQFCLWGMAVAEGHRQEAYAGRGSLLAWGGRTRDSPDKFRHND